VTPADIRALRAAQPTLPKGWTVQLEGSDKVVAYKGGRLIAHRWRYEGWVGMSGPNYALPPRIVMIEGNALLGAS
jgi:hypothetical protein